MTNERSGWPTTGWLWVIVAFLTIVVCGCVDGSPFEPELCVVEAKPDGTVVWPDSVNVLEYCRLPKIKTEVRK